MLISGGDTAVCSFEISVNVFAYNEPVLLIFKVSIVCHSNSLLIRSF